MALKANFATKIQAFISPVGRALDRTALTPNQITTLGLILTSVAAGLVATDHPVAGGWVLVAGGLMDMFDGALARARGSSAPFGGFYDSVTDRLSDGIILSAITYWMRDNPRVLTLAMVALVSALVTSYVRAKAEAIDLDCSIGLMERAERAVLIMAALVFNRWLLEPIMWVLAAGGVVTVIQRIHHVWCQIERDIPEELLAITLGDRAWNRAFTTAARKFFGAQNFEVAMDGMNDDEARGTGQAASLSGRAAADRPTSQSGRAAADRPTSQSGRAAADRPTSQSGRAAADRPTSQTDGA